MLVPTLWGWISLLLLLIATVCLWWFGAESFLARTQRVSADVLVVEGWIGKEGIKAAKAEFDRGEYRYVVATGGLSGNLWDDRRWSFATEAGELLVRLGVPPDRVLTAVPSEAGSHRTFSSAVAVWRTLHAAKIRASYINVFTLGAHARRSRVVFAKVNGSDPKVGTVSWVPVSYLAQPWWDSSERSSELVKETVGYFFEVLLNSGRISNSPQKSPAPPPIPDPNR